MIRKIAGLIVLLNLHSCINTTDKKISLPSNKFAKGFQIEKIGSIMRLDVFDPWENAANIHYSYYLVPKDMDVPDSLSDQQVIRTPIERVVTLSTTHIGFLSKLGLESTIVGVSGNNLVSNPLVRKNIEKGMVNDVGYDQNLNYELLLRMKPDLVLSFGIGSEVAANLSKMKDLGIPVVMVAEYLEENPLGRAEWLVFIASFFNEIDHAENLFNKIVMEYDSMKNIVSKISQKPRIMTGLPYKDNWWVPGGKSYMAHLIDDAGGDYLWKANNSRESFVVSLESAIRKAMNADIWINTGQTHSIQEILADDERFTMIPSLQMKRIYNDNKRLSPAGGNEVWETGPANPQDLLSDLIKIFHPDIFASDTILHYYQKLN